LPKTPACLRPVSPDRDVEPTNCRSPKCTSLPGANGWCEDHAAIFAKVRIEIEMDFRHGCPRQIVGRDRHSLRIRAAGERARAPEEHAARREHPR
jgi:hypothetical protein